MNKLVAIVGLALVTLLVLPGCGAVIAALPQVISAVTDGIMLLDQIERYVESYFAAKPNPELQEKVVKAIGKARNALIAANRTAKGAQKLDQQKVDEAFADFGVAYSELAALLDGVKIPGLRVARPGAALSAAPGELVLPEPMALKLKLQE